jgi:hypothetical protein
MMGSLQVVEVNPILDVQNRSAQLAVELVCSASASASSSRGGRRPGGPAPAGSSVERASDSRASNPLLRSARRTAVAELVGR